MKWNPSVNDVIFIFGFNPTVGLCHVIVDIDYSKPNPFLCKENLNQPGIWYERENFRRATAEEIVAWKQVNVEMLDTLISRLEHDKELLHKRRAELLQFK